MGTVLASDPTPLVHFLFYVPLAGGIASIACTWIVARFGRRKWWGLLLLIPPTAFGLWFLSATWEFFLAPPHNAVVILFAALAALPMVVALVGWYLWWHIANRPA
jgi:hypothetical protein